MFTEEAFVRPFNEIFVFNLLRKLIIFSFLSVIKSYAFLISIGMALQSYEHLQF